MKNVRVVGGLSADRLMAPVALQEIIFAIQLIAKGFSLSASPIKKQLVSGNVGVQS